MALVVFLRGVNVGGHRTFRPSVLARELRDYGVVNVGAAGTLVVLKPGAVAKFRAELRRRLPFDAEFALCDGSELTEVMTDPPFGPAIAGSEVVRFVSVRIESGGGGPALPVTLPPDGDWLVRLTASRGRFIFGEYRRHMKTIGYLGQMDRLFRGNLTTRNWNTITKIVGILAKAES